MIVLLNIAVFLTFRWLAYHSNADQNSAFLLGWLAAVCYQGLIDRFVVQQNGDVGG